MRKFKIIGKPLLGKKYVEGKKKKKKERKKKNNAKLVATMSALARKTGVRTHFVPNNNWELISSWSSAERELNFLTYPRSMSLVKLWMTWSGSGPVFLISITSSDFSLLFARNLFGFSAV